MRIDLGLEVPVTWISFELKGDPGDWNFKSEIYPHLLTLAKSKNVFWGSGNFGEPPNISLFFDRRESENLTVFATGIGDTRHDLVLLVEVSADAKVSLPLHQR